MGAIHFSIDLNLVTALRQALPLDVFVETGTFNGDTTALVSPFFSEILTIELSSEQYQVATHRLRDHTNIRPIHGSSPDVLKGLQHDLSKRSTLYWLDAHWCGGVTAGVDYECPLMDELSAIGKLNDQSVILIDDARFFLAPPPPPHEPLGWPMLEDLIQALKRLSSKHKMWIINDVLIFYPEQAGQYIIEYGRSKGIDLHYVSNQARNSLSVQKENDDLKKELEAQKKKKSTSTSSLNSLINNRSEVIFCKHLERMKIQSVLDIGANGGQFSIKLRSHGYRGTIYSVEPQSSAYAQLLSISRDDPRWVPLPRQAAGERHHSIDLNISENSWSSSILNVHENHLRAAPQTRSIRTEEVFVTKSSKLLATDIMQQVHAVKIDVQGYEAQVLAGYIDYLPNVRLLLLELSLVKCYEGAPDMLTLDNALVNDHGFSRVSFEPSFYDEANGIAQQFDGIYYRPQVANPNSAPTLEIDPVIVTSTAPQLRRFRSDGVNVGNEWYDFCVRSWANITETVVSISENPPSNPNVRWLQASSRPSIKRILNEAANLNKSHILLINSDVGLLHPFKELMIRLDPNILYYGSRVEVLLNPTNPNELIAQSVHEHGFDYFLFPTSLAVSLARDEFFPEDFLIGEPWWDYLLPLAAQSKGIPVKRLPSTPVICVHYKHEDRYNKQKWIENGVNFVRFAERLLVTGSSHNKALLNEILMVSGETENHLEQVAEIIRKSLP